MTDIKVGDTVRLTAKFLRNTGQFTGKAPWQTWLVTSVDSSAGDGHTTVVTDEKKDEEVLEYFTPEELAKDPTLRFRRINVAHLEVVRKKA